jgi:CubicO group peptidase (beta-lactamase class C family)
MDTINRYLSDSQKDNHPMNRLTIQKIFNSATASSLINEACLLVANSKGDFSESFGYGGCDADSPMLAASITKLFTTSCVLKLCEQGRLSLEDAISRYFSRELLSGLHVFKGHEYSFDLTVSDLLFQTSGLPDDFEGWKNKGILKKVILEGDTYITFEQYLDEVKSLIPRFAPNTGKKAYYANMNFDLLGEILEKVTKMPLDAIYRQFIFEPLGMMKTYLPVDEKDFVPHVYYKSQRLERPKLIASCRASGGCVSTAKDLMTFSKAFWGGRLFDKKVFDHLCVYRKLQMTKGPIFYGGGYMQIPLGTPQTLFMGKGELLGHSGSTGSFAFYYPEKDLHFTGNTSQLAKPAAPVRLVMRLAMARDRKIRNDLKERTKCQPPER